jgi:N-acetylmuramic acid 6-phosphate etherase
MSVGHLLKTTETEKRNSHSRGLDQKSTMAILRILNREDARVALAVRRELPKIARTVDAIVRSFERGGNLYYVGAGTSGRIAVLDAAECPPTFGISPRRVRAVIAGGARALQHAAEDAEDSATAGASDLRRAGASSQDVVIGISASGATPYVLGAIDFARKLGAVTIGVTSNPHSPLTQRVGVSIAPNTGPEALSGSTRLKAGTAQKMVLNLLSTTAMARLGRVYDNWMVYVALTNQKLRKRSQQILEDAAGVTPRAAEHALRQSGYSLPAALVMLKKDVDAREAKRRLAASDGNVRRAITAKGRPRPR